MNGNTRCGCGGKIPYKHALVCKKCADAMPADKKEIIRLTRRQQMLRLVQKPQGVQQ